MLSYSCKGKEGTDLNNVAYPKLGEIYYAELQYNGSVQGGQRPVVIVQNDVGNKYSPIVEVLPISSQVDKAKKKNLPIHVVVAANRENGLYRDSVVLCEQLQSINKTQLLNRIGALQHSDLERIGDARYIQSPLPRSVKHNNISNVV